MVGYIRLKLRNHRYISAFTYGTAVVLIGIYVLHYPLLSGAFLCFYFGATIAGAFLYSIVAKPWLTVKAEKKKAKRNEK